MLANLRTLIRGQKRPQHLGKYRMEMVKRVPRTTTHVSDDVPRLPKRANFFMRALHGDMGPKMKAQFPHFVTKFPLSKVMRKVIATQLPNVRAEVGWNDDVRIGSLPADQVTVTISAWEQRTERKSWNAKQIRQRLLSISREDINANLVIHI